MPLFEESFSLGLMDCLLDYMNGFRCNVTNPTSTVALAQSKVPRRCGADPSNNKLEAVPGNCTYGAKQPFYWFNLEQNNVMSSCSHHRAFTDISIFRCLKALSHRLFIMNCIISSKARRTTSSRTRISPYLTPRQTRLYLF